jgi:hypothetical protein
MQGSMVPGRFAGWPEVRQSMAPKMASHAQHGKGRSSIGKPAARTPE